MAMAFSEVLSAGPSFSLWNPALLAASIATIAAATFSAIKGLHLYRRGKLTGGMIECSPALEEIETNEEIEKLIFLVNELKRDKERLIWRNQEMQCQLQAAEEIKRSEEGLRHSHTACALELEKHKQENALLRQKASIKLVSASSKRFKVIQKKEDRKPKRVSMKKK
ncbi:hypothetical protein A3K48_02675 [candidate division WOR-1 bacterium RIFOXYA12_FULL_52_29]|uniref:Uncharacterized protein n=1 Tax=candidate division WOR-1 bacterium RIFOXYC12_FULL_54_18 TaxID=1802584 RepID=A0A1F4T597_UNCSA|nr:MAG: hypothetical protein A3K44_02675 [candidate division WOR-1 bacterium RIFOXYA2_FULL_51_19]OGC17477.1 MAG: hypothetical protein A3K48_02675 [candidate division WOR-1 bacterium RIFOXYA12_FULL_52_29]OGC26335.1 MAG: hypothetical protein A3K32_02670 [candidate division WOR-1 bacterium RIFOXYB2_FULL_45_9]OGC27894.1 MAG: hypothetical protein A3K49_02675 [candidate division WOR-1 bacterium RIFOXYC12_FULL_54_18]OGC29818.1 MAG: hypothetical protein A2346_03660 [candidate division WOR-1 bacterium R